MVKCELQEKDRFAPVFQPSDLIDLILRISVGVTSFLGRSIFRTPSL